MDAYWGTAQWNSSIGFFELTSPLPRNNSILRSTTCGTIGMAVNPLAAGAPNATLQVSLSGLGRCLEHLADEYAFGTYNAVPLNPWMLRSTVVASGSIFVPTAGNDVVLHLAQLGGIAFMQLRLPGALARRNWLVAAEIAGGIIFQYAPVINPLSLTLPTYGTFENLAFWFPPAATVDEGLGACTQPVGTLATAFMSQVMQLRSDFDYCYVQNEPLACQQLVLNRNAVGWGGVQNLLLAGMSYSFNSHAEVIVHGRWTSGQTFGNGVDLMTLGNITGGYWRGTAAAYAVEVQTEATTYPAADGYMIAAAIVDYASWNFAKLYGAIKAVPCSCGFITGGPSLTTDLSCMMNFVRAQVMGQNPATWSSYVTSGALWSTLMNIGQAASNAAYNVLQMLDSLDVLPPLAQFWGAIGRYATQGWGVVTKQVRVSVAVPSANLKLCDASIGALFARLFLDPGKFVSYGTVSVAPPATVSPAGIPGLTDFACALALTDLTGRAALIHSEFTVTVWQATSAVTGECAAATLIGNIDLGTLLANLDAIAAWAQTLSQTGAGMQPITYFLLQMLQPNINIANCFSGAPHDPSQFCVASGNVTRRA